MILFLYLLFQIICLWFQADKLECQCSYHHDAEYGEGKAQVAAIRALTHHCVTMAPANTPTIFMIPYAVALYFAEIIWQRIGILLASNMP